jgi:hypothetical protein
MELEHQRGDDYFHARKVYVYEWWPQSALRADFGVLLIGLDGLKMVLTLSVEKGKERLI